MRDAIERLPKPPDVTMLTGVVASFDSGVTVVVIGEEPIEVDRLTSYTPQVGDIVLVMVANGAITALGAIA